MSVTIESKPAVGKENIEDAAAELSLEEQRLVLRRQLAEQRELIAYRLTPNSQLRLSASGQNAAFPRSMTMRLLTRNPAPVIKLAIGVATWLLGARFSGVLLEGMQFIKMIRAGATLR